MSTHWARNALCTLAVTFAVAFVAMPLFVATDSASAGASVRANTAAPPLSLLSQSPWITPQSPWFNLSVAVGDTSIPANQLHVSLTFYTRIDDESQFAQAVGAVPQNGVLLHDTPIAVTQTASGRLASACVTAVRDSEESPPASGTGACGPGSDTLTLDCTPGTGRCGDVYPVSVALLRQGSTSPLARFTTFLTYQEPGAIGVGGPLRVGAVVPVTSADGLTAVATAMSDHKDIATTLALSPLTVKQAIGQHTRADARSLSELASLPDAQVTPQSYVPIDLASLSEAGIAGEIVNQIERGDALLHQAGLKPSSGPWVDTVSNFNQGDGPALATGVATSGAVRLVVNDDNLSSAGLANYTFAQPFTLDLAARSTGSGASSPAGASSTGVPAAASNSTLSARFTAQPNDPVLGAEQLLAGLSFVHFENAFLHDARGVIVEPPAGWRPSTPFLETLLSGLTGNPALTPVTLDQFFDQVPVGGNREPATRHLQAGPASGGISKVSAEKIVTARLQLSSFGTGPNPAVAGHPPEIEALSDALLASEARGLSTAGRAAVLAAYNRAFDAQIGKITIATERTVTFTAQRAPIPITVLNGTSYPVTVVMTLASDEFTFPNGSTQTLTLVRPTTSVRVVAQARTSGGRLPIDVTLRTPDGQLLLARTELTVHSTAISFVGVALTIVAGIVLLAWWGRTWRRSRRARPRAQGPSHSPSQSQSQSPKSSRAPSRAH